MIAGAVITVFCLFIIIIISLNRYTQQRQDLAVNVPFCDRPILLLVPMLLSCKPQTDPNICLRLLMIYIILAFCVRSSNALRNFYAALQRPTGSHSSR